MIDHIVELVGAKAAEMKTAQPEKIAAEWMYTVTAL